MVLRQVKDCPRCHEPHEVTFEVPGDTVEDVVEVPGVEVSCPVCGHAYHATYDGWTAHQEAG